MNKKVNYFERFKFLRSKLKDENYDAIILNTKDSYLNEYISLSENPIFYYSGFTGSSGNLLITLNEAYLFVDGRYYIQAAMECDSALINIIKVAFPKANIEELSQKLINLTKQSKKLYRIVFDYSKISFYQYKYFKSVLKSNIIFIHNNFLIPFIKKSSQNISLSEYEIVPIHVTGRSTHDKLKDVQSWLKEKKYDFLFVNELNNLAYFCNMRSNKIPYSSSFKGLALLGSENLLFLNTFHISQNLINHFSDILKIFLEKNFNNIILKILKKYISNNKNVSRKIRISVDYKTISYNIIEFLKKSFPDFLEFIHTENPLSSMKSLKNSSELKVIQQNCHKTDLVVKKIIKWVNTKIKANETISEKDVFNQLKYLFNSHGAKGLSFQMIVACEENTAIVHYSKSKSDKYLKEGNLMLLDIGAYFEGGYSTDISRSFLIASTKATEKQKKIYTLVLKSSIRILNLKFQKGTKAYQLDVLSRSLLLKYGYVYNHGTGHGIGISVHETPPSINPNSQGIIEENMVFSIEPGIYIENIFGVRIENLVVVEKEKLIRNYLKLRLLTFAPLDNNLIDYKYLDDSEKNWLENYQKKSEELLF